MTPVQDLWRANDPLLLASGSAIRRQLLEAAGIPIVVRPVSLDEAALAASLTDTGASPREIAVSLARAKGLEASKHAAGQLVLAADQTLDDGGRLGMKSANIAEARNQLVILRGKTHHLHAAACLVRDGKVLWEACSSPSMTMRVFSDAFLDTYIAHMGPRLCATVGGYEFEASGSHLFKSVEGEHAAILGLPMRDLLAAFRQLGMLLA